MSVRHKEETVRFVTAGNPQEAQLRPPSVEDQGIRHREEAKTSVVSASTLLGMWCRNLGSIGTMPTMPRGLWKA